MSSKQPPPMTTMSSAAIIDQFFLIAGAQIAESTRTELAQMLDGVRVAGAPPAPRPAPTVGVLVTREHENLVAAVDAATALINFLQGLRGIPTPAQIAQRQSLEHAWLAALQALGRNPQSAEPANAPRRNQRRRD